MRDVKKLPNFGVMQQKNVVSTLIAIFKTNFNNSLLFETPTLLKISTF
jgi:hypothetical protein